MDSTTTELQQILSAAPQASLAELRERFGLPAGASPARITREICSAGGSSAVNLFRGGGVEYGEIVRDVAGFLGVKAQGDTAALEQAILNEVWRRYQKTATPEELQDIRATAERERQRAQQYGAVRAVAATAGTRMAAHFALQALGQQLFWQLLRTVVLPRLGLWTAARLAIAGPAAVLGPVGWALAGAAALYELDKPAMRKLLPTVLQIAVLRGAG